MRPLILLLATSFALAQDQNFLTVLPPQSESSDLDLLTTVTTTSTSVVSYATSVIEFRTTLEDGSISLVTVVTKPPGPPQTSVIIVTTTRRRTSTVYQVPSAVSTSSPPTSASASTSSRDPATSSNLSTATTPGVSTSPTTTETPVSIKKGIGTTNIVLIVFGIVAAFIMVGSGAYFMKKRRTREEVDERNAAYRNRGWNSARPVISSPLNPANLAALDNLVMSEQDKSTLNSLPSRPERPASLSESVQESMRTTPVAGLRKAPTASGRSVDPALAMMSGARSMSPDPLNIVKKGSEDRSRSNTHSSTAPQFGDYYTRSPSGSTPSQLEQLQKLEQELGEEARTGKLNETPTYVHTEPEKPEESAQSVKNTTKRHSTPPPTLSERAFALPREQRFSDPDEDDEDVRAARRASTQRKLDGASLRSASTSPPMYDSISARAEKQRLIAQKQKLIADHQKKMGGKEKNITDFSAGPMPTYAPPPPPGPSPKGYI